MEAGACPPPAGIEKHGGRVLLRTHVDSIVVEGGRAAGVRLRPKGGGGGQGDSAAGTVIRARKAVVSNASVWDTLKLLPQGGPAHGRGLAHAGLWALCMAAVAVVAAKGC